MVALLFLLVLGGMASSLVVLNGAAHKEHKFLREETKSFYLAEAGLNEALAMLNAQGVTGLNTIVYPRDFDAGDYIVEATHGAVDPEIRLDYIRLRSVGDAGGEDIGAQLMVWDVPTGFFRWAVFGDQWVNLDSNVMIDSFDSNDGPYPTGVDWVSDYGNAGSERRRLGRRQHGRPRRRPRGAQRDPDRELEHRDRRQYGERGGPGGLPAYHGAAHPPLGERHPERQWGHDSALR